MPELPEVETVRTILTTAVAGRTIRDLRFGEFTDVMGGLAPADARARLTGSTIQAVHRRGKYLILTLDDDALLLIHLRMTGRLLVVPSPTLPIRFEHLAIVLDNGTDLRFGDQRKFGRVLLIDSSALDHLERRLGPEPLERSFTAARLHRALKRRPGKLKSVLLDQHFIAGLGNIYVDEALFRARLHPLRAASSLSPAETARLHRAIRAVLRQGIANQGTTFSSFENPYGEEGDNARRLQVYGRSRVDSPCPRCGHLLERLVVGGRGTTVCPHCQPLNRATLAPRAVPAQINELEVEVEEPSAVDEAQRDAPALNCHV